MSSKIEREFTFFSLCNNRKNTKNTTYEDNFLNSFAFKLSYKIKSNKHENNIMNIVKVI